MAPLVLVNLSAVKALTGEAVNITANALDDNGITDYLFDFGDGTTSAWTRYGNYTRTYGAPGNYSIRVKARDGSGLESYSEPIVLTVRAPPKKYVPPAPTIAELIAGLPVLFWYAVFVVIVACAAGAGLRQIMKAQRRRKLYEAVEKAEAEREARHTREIDEEDSAGFYGGGTAGSHGASPGGFRGMHPGRPAHHDHPGGFRGVSPGALGAPHPHDRHPSAPYHARSSPAHGTGHVPEAPAQIVDPGAPAEADFGGSKVVERTADEEVVYEAEIGSSKPIWAQSSKDPGPKSSRPARIPEHVARKVEPAPKPDGGVARPGEDIDDLLNELNDNT
jgi:PKD repeat protein